MFVTLVVSKIGYLKKNIAILMNIYNLCGVAVETNPLTVDVPGTIPGSVNLVNEPKKENRHKWEEKSIDRRINCVGFYFPAFYIFKKCSLLKLSF